MIEWLAGQWPGIFSAVGVAGLIGLWLKGWLLWLVPVSYPQAGRFLRFRWVELSRWPVVAKQEGRFLVVVCCLDGDDATDSAMRVVARALRTEQSLHPVLDWRRLSVGDAADQTAAELRARNRAVQIGRQYRADVIVWGEVATAGEGLRLHFQGAGQVMTRDLTIPNGFLEQAYREPLDRLLGLIVAIAALVEVAALTGTGAFVADRLAPLAQQLKKALAAPPPGLDAGQRAELQFALGLALAQIGEQRGDEQALRDAVTAYREALEEYTRERVPLQWAMTQNNLGNALTTLGERGDDAALRDAVTAYGEALTEFTREGAPLAWAITQGNLGAALRVLGERRGDKGTLRKAVTAYRKAETELTRERVPLQWAMTQNNLGTVLRVLGELGDDAAMCDAVTAFRDALKEFTRERVPLNWARSQNNLGNALARLGERGDDAALRDAVTAYRLALEERTRERVPRAWAMTQSNLGSALARLGERGDDDALRDAVTAFRDALKERTRERVPLGWAMTQANLAVALTTQAKRSGDCSLVAEALAALDGAIAEFAARDAPSYLAKAKEDRERIIAIARALGCP